MIKEALLSILSSGSSLCHAAYSLGDYLDRKATDLDKAKLARVLLESCQEAPYVPVIAELECYIDQLTPEPVYKHR